MSRFETMGLKAGGFERDETTRERDKGRDCALRLDSKIEGEERDLGLNRVIIRENVVC